MSEQRTLKWEGISLTVLLSTVVAYLIIVAMVLQSQRASQLEDVLTHRESVVRVMAASLGDKLTNPDTRSAALVQVRYSENNSLFLYAAIATINGTTLAQVGEGNLPELPANQHAQDWSGSSEVTMPDSGETIAEVRAPLLRDGDLVGQLRMGYRHPQLDISMGRLPFFALLALPLFLLTGGIYWFLRREIQPLGQLSTAVETCTSRGDFSLMRGFTEGDVGRLAQNLLKNLEHMQHATSEAHAKTDDLAVENKILAYKRNRMESVLDALPDHIIVLDETGLATFASDKITSLFGIPAEEVEGKPVNEWCEDENIRRFLMRHETRASIGHSSEDLKFTPAAAPEKTISISTYPLFAVHNREQLLGKMILFRDVTIEDLAARSRADFVAHMSHELKTPLNVLAMYSESLLENGDDEEFRTEGCNVIHDEVERLATLINNLLSITQFEMGSMKLDRQRVRLQDLLQDAFDNIARAGKEKNIKFEINLPRELTPIFVDKDLLRIAINNLMTNAIKYNKPGGTVALSAEETDDLIRIKVSDTGIGIAPDNWHKVFEKFYRVEDDEVRQRSGHGLGLPLAMQIVQLHHGNISVQSEPGEGTEFTIEFNKQSGLLRRAAET